MGSIWDGFFYELLSVMMRQHLGAHHDTIMDWNWTSNNTTNKQTNTE